MEIQTRQTAVPTSFNPVGNAYTGLQNCVSLNTAVAALVGSHRVSFQPKLDAGAGGSGLELRIDGVVTSVDAAAVELDGGGRVMKSEAGGIMIEFPNKTRLVATPGFWDITKRSYVNVSVFETTAAQGIMGMIVPGSWLPALPDGTRLGQRPADLHQRYVELYQTFGNAWRVTKETSLFDYAPGTSTESFSMMSWPPERPPCVIPGTTPLEPADPAAAQKACAGVTDKALNEDCVFDVTVTGELGMGETYAVTEAVKARGGVPQPEPVKPTSPPPPPAPPVKPTSVPPEAPSCKCSVNEGSINGLASLMLLFGVGLHRRRRGARCA